MTIHTPDSTIDVYRRSRYIKQKVPPGGGRLPTRPPPYRPDDVSSKPTARTDRGRGGLNDSEELQLHHHHHVGRLETRTNFAGFRLRKTTRSILRLLNLHSRWNFLQTCVRAAGCNKACTHASAQRRVPGGRRGRAGKVHGDVRRWGVQFKNYYFST